LNLDLPWLRFWDTPGNLLLSGSERAEQEHQRAERLAAYCVRLATTRTPFPSRRIEAMAAATRQVPFRARDVVPAWARPPSALPTYHSATQKHED
jgi:hypothetical protein